MRYGLVGMILRCSPCGQFFRRIPRLTAAVPELSCRRRTRGSQVRCDWQGRSHCANVGEAAIVRGSPVPAGLVRAATSATPADRDRSGIHECDVAHLVLFNGADMVERPFLLAVRALGKSPLPNILAERRRPPGVRTSAGNSPVVSLQPGERCDRFGTRFDWSAKIHSRHVV